MKLKVSTKLPYGEWMEAETATLQDLMDAAPPDVLMPRLVVPELAHGHGTGNKGSDGNGLVQVIILMNIELPAYVHSQAASCHSSISCVLFNQKEGWNLQTD